MSYPVEMVPVQSSNIRSIGSQSAVVAVFVEFSSGARYQYTGPGIARLHADFMAAESKGSFFAKHIKNNKALTCVKVVDAQPAAAAPAP